MHVVQRIPKRVHRRMYSPHDRVVVNGVGLGELDGMFNIGKMFTRMFTFTPSSFKFKNIAGAIGSAVMTVGSGGIANIASEIAGPSGLKLTKGSITGARSDVSKIVGYGTMAAAAAAAVAFGGYALLPAASGVAGAGGAAVTAAGTGMTSVGVAAGAGGTFAGGTAVTAASGGFLSAAGSVFGTIGSGLMTVMKVLPVLGTVMGGMGGGGGQQQQQQQQGGMTQAEYDAQVYAQQQQQAAYEAQVRAQQQQMYQPTSYTPEGYSGGVVQQPSMNTSYGDLRSPYTAITEDGQQVQVDPATGQVIQPGMSTEMMLGIGGIAVLAAGWYFMSASKSNN